MAPRGHLGPALWGPPGPGCLPGASLLLVVLGRPVGGHGVCGAGDNGVTAQVPGLLRRCRVLGLGFLDRLVAEPDGALATGRGQHLAAVLLLNARVELGGGGHGRGGQELVVSGRCYPSGSQAATLAKMQD